MPTPSGVNYLLLFLQYYLLIPQLSDDKNLKVDIHPICPYQLYHSLPIGILVLRVKHYYVTGFDF